MVESIHVAVAAHDLYPDPGSGGTGRYVYETSRRLVDAGHRVSVVTRRRGDVPARETVDGIDVYRYDVSVAGESAPTILRQLPDATRAVREHAEALSSPAPPDVVSFQGPLTSLLLDRALGSAPRVATFHSPWPTEYGIKTRDSSDVSGARRRLNVGTRWLVERYVLARSDRVIVLSEFMRDRLRAVYGDGREATVVPGGVDVERFRPDPVSAGSNDDAVSDGSLVGDGSDGPTADGGSLSGDGPISDADPAFLTVRRLSERMGHRQLLDGFAAVRETHPAAHLYVAGDGPLREPLERRAERLGVADATTFLGYVPDADLPAAYAAADAFVLPTQELEGFGLATLEALASGTPVVATPVGGTVEVLDGLGDRLPASPLTAAPDATDLADGMREWAELDPDVRDDAGQTCRRYVRENYTWERTARRLREEYERLL